VSRFAATLRQTSQRLNLPGPVKSRVLLELAGDLEDLFEHFSGEGRSDDEAVAMALEHAELSDQALQRLVAVHASPRTRFVERLSERTAAGWERLLLLLVLVFAAGMVGWEVVTWQLFAGASVFIWPLAAVFVAGLVVAGWKTYELLLAHSRDLRRIRRGLPSLLALSVVSVIIGWLGFLLEMHNAALRVAPNARSLAEQSVRCLARVAPMICFGLATAVVLAIAWFVLGAKAARLEQAEVAALLEEGSAP
jgi:hypothetical protein